MDTKMKRNSFQSCFHGKCKRLFFNAKTMLSKSFKLTICKIIFSLLLTTFSLPNTLAAENSIKLNQKVISIGKTNIKLNYLTITNPNKYKFVVTYSNPIGTVAELKKLVYKENGIAGINGTFFDAYNPDPTKRYPNGILINNTMLIRGGKNVCFWSDRKTFGIGNINTKITGAINGSYKWPNNWYAWNINHIYPSKQQIVILTSAFGKTPDDNGINVIVERGKVTNIINVPVIPPKDGYVIHLGQDSKIKERFHIGDIVEYKVEFEINGQPINGKIKFAVGAGPKLLTNGKVNIDYDRDGFKSEKIRSWRSSRSFIGIHKNGSIIMGTTPTASIKELATALLKLGLTDAMNLDGGASSSLYFKGKYITKPGRKISNALVVVENK